MVVVVEKEEYDCWIRWGRRRCCGQGEENKRKRNGGETEAYNLVSHDVMW